MSIQTEQVLRASIEKTLAISPAGMIDMTPNCTTQKTYRLFALGAIVAALLGGEACAQVENDEPAPLLRGGFVQQLRSLSEDAFDSLQTTERNEASQRPARPLGRPTGRTTVRRTNPSAWVEGSRNTNVAPTERSQPLADGLGRIAPTAGTRRANEQPVPLRDPAPISTPARVTPRRAVDESNLPPITTPQERLRQLRGNTENARSTPSTTGKPVVPEVHVADQLPPEVRNSIYGSSPPPSLSSDVTSSDRQSSGSSNPAPQVSRIPLPSSGSSQGNNQASRSTARRSSDASSSSPSGSIRESVTGRVPATLVSTPEEDRLQSSDRNDDSTAINTELPTTLPSIPSLPATAENTSSLDVDASVPALPQFNQELPVESDIETSVQSNAQLTDVADMKPQEIAVPEPTSELPTATPVELDATAALPSLPSLQLPTPPTTPTAPAIVVPSVSPTRSSSGQTAVERLRMETPRIAVVLEGPENLPINKVADYAIRVVNPDNINLSGLVLRLDVPPGVLAQPGKPTHGDLQVEQGADKATLFTWTFEDLAAGQTAVAPLALTAQSARNFGLAMEWTVLPMTGQADMEITAPALELMLEGPSEVDFGVPSTYRLRIKNPGSADARGVAVALTAESYGSSASEIGTIKAGGEEIIDVELTFNEVGTINIAASATGEMDLSSATRINVLVRRAALEASISAPQIVYHGTQTDYLLRITNSGNATATNVEAIVNLPNGATLINLPEQTWLNDQVMTWKISEIAAGASADLPIQLSLGQEGSNTLKMACESTLGLTASCTVSTEVQAFSDLKLFVADPIAPAPVGQEVCYELTLTNRGSKAATNVSVVAQFSEGIEPLRSEGKQGRVIPGQLLFDPIQRVEPGQTLTLKVYAKAEQTGTHRFRAEVRTDNSDVRLVQEESTTFLNGVGRIAAPTGGRPIIR